MYSFREIVQNSDLEKYFRLRRDLYLQTALAPFLNDNDAGIDLDLHDLHSKFYGLYAGEDLVGGIRLIVDKAAHYNSHVYDLGRRHRIYDDRCGDPAGLQVLPHDDFPFVGYSDETRAFYERWRGDHPFCEAGRFVICDDHRGMKLAQFVIECTTVTAMIHSGARVGLGVTFASYPKAYRRYGYHYIGETEHYMVNGVKLAGVVGRLCLDLSEGSSVPEHLHDRFEGMAEEFMTTGRMVAAL